ncbi:MAG: DUF4331 domain-containing protein [Ilumatobacteraceae bacterium]|nr:DUF4331 domain-containing protein [Ilumatobacteraceae bacterium]
MQLTRPSARTGKRGAVIGAALALVGGAIAVGGPGGTTASSHREAPLIAGDPRADNTDVYAFVSPDDTDTVTLISNWIPFEEPNGGPNFYPWAEDTRYNIKIDNDGDALEDITYTWEFTTQYDGSTFLYNNGPVTSLDDENLLYFQTYDLIQTISAPGVADVSTTLLDDVRAAPSLTGPGSIPDYAPLMEQATYDLFSGEGQTYAGQADDPFFLDLRVFDLLYGGDLSEVGEDTLAGYNVNSVAIQVPKTLLAAAGAPDANPVIGIWSTTDRRSVRNADGSAQGAVEYTQVSRLGNPLVNEVVLPLALKDAFNGLAPADDASVAAAVDAVTNPILPELIESIYGVPAPEGPRYDLQEIFLQGVSVANAGLGGDPDVVLPVDLNGHNLNAVANTTTTLRPSEQLRLNMSIAPSANPNRLGLFAEQFDGFPNGRRLGDDVVDIAIQTVEGAAQSGQLVAALAAGDAVDRNDREFRSTFPYLALPHNDSVNNGTERPPRASEFVTVSPDRVLETRSQAGQIGFIGDKPGAGDVVEVKVTGVGSSLVPDDAQAVAVNVTVTENEGPTFVTAFDCDDDQPTASNVNSLEITGGTSNLTLVGISDAGTICLYTLAASHLVADIGGYVPSTSGVTPVTPERILETREEFGQTGYSGSQPAAGATIVVDVGSSDQVEDGATAAFLNVTSTDSTAPGFVTVWDCEGNPPTASTLNYEPGAVIPNLAVAQLSDEGTVCLYTLSGTDLIVDLMGVLPADSQYTPAGPERILETREEFGQVGYSGSQPQDGQVVEVQVTGVGDAAVPAGTSAAFLNITTTNESSVGFITVWPCGVQQPTASNGNYRGEGQSTANLVAANIGEGGKVCIFLKNPADLVVDLVGYFPGLGVS